jgi:hypothetical protein
MGKFSQKMMGKEVGQAAEYATPHSMSGGPAKLRHVGDPNKLSAVQVTPSSGSARVSAGDPARNDVKTSGIETRGNGAATKGRMARGPMA